LPGTEVCDEVICRNEARREKEADDVSKKKTKLRVLISSAKVIKDKMKNKTYKLNRKDLLVLVRYKHAKGDQKIPSAVADLHGRWNEMQNCASPQSSPSNSDVKERRTSMTRRVGRWVQLD
jgi:hypothetical protein